MYPPTLVLEDHGIRVTASENHAFAITSVVKNGVEYINSTPDFGRDLQTACQEQDQYDSQGEDRNPTEAGQGGVPSHLKSASIILNAGIENGTLITGCQAAFWKQFQGRVVSNTVIRKHVTIHEWGLDYRVQIDPQGIDEAEATRWVFETVTGYMPDFFNRGEFVPETGDTIPAQVQPVNDVMSRDISKHPVIVSSSDDQHCMGVILENPERRYNYAFLKFKNEPISKWAAVTADYTPDAIYRFNLKVFIGTRQEVIQRMRGKL